MAVSNNSMKSEGDPGRLFGPDWNASAPPVMDASVSSRRRSRDVFLRRVLGWIHLAATELAAEKRRASSAWIDRLASSPAQDEASAWENYAAAVKRRTGKGIRHDEIEALFHRAPAVVRTPLANLRVIVRAGSEAERARMALQLAEDYVYRRKHPALSAALLQTAEGDPSLSGRVRELHAVVRGEGPLLKQIRYEGSHLLRELLSPISLASFGAAVWSARLAGNWVIRRSVGYGLKTWAQAEGLALAVEVPAMILTRRLGLAALVGGQDLFSFRSVGGEWLASIGPFAMLRGSGNLFTFAAPWCRRAVGLEGGGGRFLLKTLQVEAEVTAVLAGHKLNAYLGIENPLPLGDNVVISALMTVGHMRAAGGILNGMRRYGAQADLAGLRRSQWAEKLHHGEGGGERTGKKTSGVYPTAVTELQWAYAGAVLPGGSVRVSQPQRVYSKARDPEVLGPPASRISGWGVKFMPDPRNNRRALENFIDRWAEETRDVTASLEAGIIKERLDELPGYMIEHLASFTRDRPVVTKGTMVYLGLVPWESPMVRDPSLRGDFLKSSLETDLNATNERLNAILDTYQVWGRAYYPENPPVEGVNFDKQLLSIRLSQLPAPVLEAMVGYEAAFGPLFYMMHRMCLAERKPPASRDFVMDPAKVRNE